MTVERLDKGDLVRVNAEQVTSVVVLPTYCKPRDEDVPEDTPDITICCEPVALIRTPASEDGELRWVKAEELTRISGLED